MFTLHRGPKRDKNERNFFTKELAYLLPTGPREIILAGDFNCVIAPADSNGSRNLSKALSSTIAGLALHDAWDQSSKKKPSILITRTMVPQESTGYI